LAQIALALLAWEFVPLAALSILLLVVPTFPAPLPGQLLSALLVKPAEALF